MNGRTPYPVDCDGLRFSFEYFPPKNDEMETQLFQTVTALSVFAPAFVTVTYGAGGSTKARSLTTVKRMIGEMEIANTAAHLTCVGAPKAEVDAVIDEFLACGVRHFVALRGDPQGGIGSVYEPFPGGYENAAALVKALRARGDFEISVSAYPEKHPESPDVAADIDMRLATSVSRPTGSPVSKSDSHEAATPMSGTDCPAPFSGTGGAAAGAIPAEAGVAMTAAATVTYTIKHKAENKLEEVRRLDAAIKLEEDTIDLLKADWALLTQPNRLERLVTVFAADLQLAPTPSTQLARPEELPMLRADLPPSEEDKKAKDKAADNIAAVIEADNIATGSVAR